MALRGKRDECMVFCSVAEHRRQRPFIRHMRALDRVDRPTAKQRLGCSHVQEIVVIEPGLSAHMEWNVLVVG